MKTQTHFMFHIFKSQYFCFNFYMRQIFISSVYYVTITAAISFLPGSSADRFLY